MKISNSQLQQTYASQQSSAQVSLDRPNKPSPFDIQDSVEISTAALRGEGDGQVLPPVDLPIDV